MSRHAPGLELVCVQERRKTVSITPQLDLERCRVRVSPHFRVSPRVSMFSARTFTGTRRCRYACTCTGMNVWPHQGENAFVIVLPVQARSTRKRDGGWSRCQPPQFPEGFQRYKLPIIEYEALPFSKTRLENGQSLAAFRTSSVETSSRRNIDSPVERHDPGRTDNARFVNYWNAISGD